jgi:hypothetical protein
MRHLQYGAKHNHKGYPMKTRDLVIILCASLAVGAAFYNYPHPWAIVGLALMGGIALATTLRVSPKEEVAPENQEHIMDAIPYQTHNCTNSCSGLTAEEIDSLNKLVREIDEAFPTRKPKKSNKKNAKKRTKAKRNS